LQPFLTTFPETRATIALAAQQLDPAPPAAGADVAAISLITSHAHHGY